jgi:hypothetical protein
MRGHVAAVTIVELDEQTKCPGCASSSVAVVGCRAFDKIDGRAV